MFEATQQKPDSVQNPLEPNDIKKKRRTKGDDSDRKHVCKICLKTYLSYPALYTHTKSKHEKTPGKITESDLIKKNINIQPSLFINQLTKFLRNESTSTLQHYTLQDVLKPFEEKTELADSISFWESNGQEVMNEESKCFRTSIDQAIVKLINNLLNKVEVERLQELCAVLLIWRESMNSGWKNHSIPGNYRCYSQEADSQFMLRSVNDLVLTYFPNSSKKYLDKISNVSILRGQSMEVNLCKMIITVGKWLYAEKYTTEKLKYNETD